MWCGTSKRVVPVLTVGMLLMLALLGCRGQSTESQDGGVAVEERHQGQQPQKGERIGDAGKKPGPATRPAGDGPFVLKGMEVVRAELARPHTVIDAGGEKRQYTHAHIVFLEIEGLRFSGPALEVLIGDYKVPEYGGWERGIYFKVYEPALLEKLAGQEMRWRFIDRTGSFGLGVQGAARGEEGGGVVSARVWGGVEAGLGGGSWGIRTQADTRVLPHYRRLGSLTVRTPGTARVRRGS